MFFSEEKNQKTFPYAKRGFATTRKARLRRRRADAIRRLNACGADSSVCEAPGKSFLVLFFKKEPLPFSNDLQATCASSSSPPPASATL
jgi:hypothetical protein